MRRHRGLVVGVAALIVIAIAGAAYVFAPRAGNAASPSTTSALSIADLQVEPLTTSGTADRPAISPDGNYVVYVENGGGQQSLRVRQVATGSNVEIVPGEPGVGLMGATVTPDGAFVNYVRRVGQQQSPELWQIPFLGGSPHRLLPGIGGRVSFSPDGNQMAFVRASGPGRTELVVASSDGSNERVVAARQMPEQFWAVDQNQTTLTVCDLETCSSPKTFPLLGQMGRWMPDNRALAYVDPRTQSDIWVQPLDGGPPRQLTHFPADGQEIWDFDWSADGKRLAVARARMASDIVLFRGLTPK
jgi:Tol biopolymer transport system component